MSKAKSERPEWFKFWRRNRLQLDIEQLDMHSRGIVFTNMMRYFDGADDLLPMNPLEGMAFNVVKINVDDSFSEYAATSAQNRENANKRWHGEDATASDRIQSDAKHAEDRRQRSEVRGQKSEVRGVSKTDKPPRVPRFVPPTVDEVKSYCVEHGYHIDAQAFCDYYASIGWVRGKSKIKDWKACVRTWVSHDDMKQTSTNPFLEQLRRESAI